MGTIENCNSVEILKEIQSGSYAKAYFIKKDNKYYYRKMANTTTGGVDKLNLQLEFLLKYGKELKMSKIEKYFCDNECCYYDMLSNNCHSSFFSFIQQGKSKENWEYLQNVLGNIKNFHNNHVLNFNSENLKNYINNKVFGNVDYILNKSGEYIQNFLTNDTVIINGQPYKNLNYYFGPNGVLSYDILYNSFKQDKCSVIHGDLTIDNIIYDQSIVEKVYLIDPNVGNVHETSYLDYAKMLQSLHGNYEFYNNVVEVEIGKNFINYNLGNTKNYEDLYQKYDQYLIQNFTKKEYKSVYLHEIVHWLRLMPYKINKNPRTATLYYAQLLIILNDFENKFKGDYCED